MQYFEYLFYWNVLALGHFTLYWKSTYSISVSVVTAVKIDASQLEVQNWY